MGVQQASQVVWDPPTGPRRFSASTIYKWMGAEEKAGAAGLVSSNRSDRGRPRVIVSRAFDTLFLERHPEGHARLKSIAGIIGQHARSMFASNLKMSLAVAARSAAALLYQEALKARLKEDERLSTACRLSKDWASPFAVKKHVAIYDKDRKRHFDSSQPRIQRAVDGMAPMELVHFDVHPVDIRYLMETGETIRVRLIAAQDHATRRLYGYPVFLAPGRGVRQAEIAEAFIDFATDQSGGMPGTACGVASSC